MELTLAEVQAATEARVLNMPDSGVLDEIRARGWSIDSRTAASGDLFFAIKGERYDGHVFVEGVMKAGAVAAVVSEAAAIGIGPLLEVSDTVRALQQAAHWARRQWGRPVVAVTGSAGKTSTKDIVAQLLSTRLRVGKTIGNFNNHIGLPLALLRIPEDAEVGVLEMGMSHAGEIRHLAAIAEPSIGVVTTVGYAHVEAFDSIEGVAGAKRELIESLPDSGVAVLNADDERVLAFRDAHSGRTLTYGFSEKAEVRATAVEMDAEGAWFTVSGVRFRTRLVGRHSVSNILAGLAVAKLFELDFEHLVGTVAALAPETMRGERRLWNGITILNDSYNSNPEAARNMVDVLTAEPARRRIAVLGEMLELGQFSEKLHRDLGVYAANAGVDVLVGVRGVSRLMVEEARKAGLAGHAALFFDEPEEAGAFLRLSVRAGDAVLFKGSRATHVEKALATMEA
ncbi:MAG: UDP-N-acetylmuramoyl-tripeptide--D-alanyl-D-alanine ligase [Bryobacteraceae bacterium]